MRRPRATPPAAGIAARRATGRLADSAPAGQQAPKRSRVVSEATRAKTDALSVLQASMSEAELQRTIRGFLEQRGFVVWVVPMMKRTRAGLPDLTFWHPARPGCLWCWELKAQHGRIRPEQQAALAHLATVPGVDARIVRPDEWESLRDTLVREVGRAWSATCTLAPAAAEGEAPDDTA